MNKLVVACLIMVCTLALSVVAASPVQGQEGYWLRADTKENMTGPKNLAPFPAIRFTGKSDDAGMTYEQRRHGLDGKDHAERGHFSWTLTGGSAQHLVPGSRLVLRGKVSSLASEGSATGYVTLGRAGFTKGGVSVPPGSEQAVTGEIEVPKPIFDKNGNAFLSMTFSLSGGNDTKFVERTLVYKWTSGRPPAGPSGGSPAGPVAGSRGGPSAGPSGGGPVSPAADSPGRPSAGPVGRGPAGPATGSPGRPSAGPSGGGPAGPAAGSPGGGPGGPSASGDGFTGEWVIRSIDSKLSIRRNGDGYDVQFVEGGVLTVRGRGVVVGGRLIFVFTRADRVSDGGFAVYELAGGRLNAKHFNLDFSNRWHGTYVRP